jgi:ubiquinone/menaquinone biosynthesis C-methylase UbiE
MNTKEDIQKFWNKKPCGTFGNIPEEANQSYFDKIKKRRYVLEPFILDIAQFQNYTGKKVLEIGCGIGMDGIEFAKIGAEYTGVDLSDQSIALCKKHFEIFNTTGNIINTDAENLPFEDNTFDLVYSWGVLHHIPDMQKSINEVYRVLKPGGEIKIMIYNKYSLVGLQLYLVYGLLKFKLFRSFDNLFFNHHESVGTKAFTDKETFNMFKGFSDLKIYNIVTPYDVRITRNKFLPAVFQKLIPSRFGFFKIILGSKKY